MSSGPDDAPTLRIRLLGTVEVRIGDTPLPPLDSGRAASLLGYLLVHRGVPQARQRLAFIFWPDSSEAQARTNLRHVLHTMRRWLPDADRFLEATSRTLRWREEGPYDLDLADFEHALADGRLQAAVDAYTGDLIPDSYDDWVLEERERLRLRFVDALARLLRDYEEHDDWADAIRCAERLSRTPAGPITSPGRGSGCYGRRRGRARGRPVLDRGSRASESSVGRHARCSSRAAKYRLRVPRPLPAKLFWSITVYDTETHSEIHTEREAEALRLVRSS